MIPILLFYIVCWWSIIPWIGSQQGATEAKCSTLYNILKMQQVVLCVWERLFKIYISKHLNVTDGSCCLANNDSLPSRFLSLVSVFTYVSYSAYLTCNHPGCIQTQKHPNSMNNWLSVSWRAMRMCPALPKVQSFLSFLRSFKWTF